ncbi:related to MAK21 - protein required for 60S ribosomal subunit biogenesis [Melanopsichium pennsylvanicum]|uniref:Related to MAK21 - protein required for 60S ribosomal subunit biogenesis n=2 Tax=Melanopsichium pennsylvanicum TaxID=63383 RepID=A0AAJ4XKG1_9BASI|nr:related to MAK21 - protein required for 60S ribosomal subunit biogenesis [Melanopsichium pennsylvanicum]
MTRDFRPKGARSVGSNGATPKHAQVKQATDSPAPSRSTPSKASTKSTTKKTATPSKAKSAYDSEDSADEDTLMREIESFGGSRADLELISKANGKKNPTVQIDEAALSGDVAAFLKQLQSNPSASAPIDPASSAKKPQKTKAAVETPNKTEASKQNTQEPAKNKTKPKENVKEANKKANREAEAKAKAAHKVQKAQKEQSTSQNTITESNTAQRMGKGKKMVFDDEGVAKETKIKPSHSARGPLRLEAVPQWMSQALLKLPSTTSGNDTLSHDRITQLLDLGADLLREESRAYDDITSSETSLNKAGGSIGTLTASDAQFVRSLLSSEGGGTLSDRISALTLLVQSSPVHNVKHMDNLLNMTRKKSREEASRATRALADWLASEGGLGSRKLRYFRDQPQLSAASIALYSGDLVASEAAKSHILLWAFEDHLKKFYFQFLQILEIQSHDTIPFTRKQATTQIFILLRDKPEQEQNLLRLLVNKLGDPERSVASKTSNHILELLTAHPAMKFIVVREIANLIMRPTPVSAADEEQGKTSNHSTHARYYGLLTLNQTVLTTKDEATANHLILLYFELFEGILKANEVKEAKGIVDGEDGEDGKEFKRKDKKRWKDQPRKGRGKGKGKGKGKAKQAASAKPEEPKLVKDAESKMVVALLAGVRRAFPFAKLESSVFEKHVNTLFKILHSGSFNVSIQALQLIFQLTISNPHQESSATLTSAAITDRFYRVLYDSLLDPRLEASSKQAMYLNLIFQALKADPEQERVKAFVKRICQILSLHQPSFICGCLHLLGELFKRTPGLRAMLTEPEEDDEEHFHDVTSSDEEEEDAEKKLAAAAAKVMAQNTSTKYDGRKREPRFAHAGTTCLWDVLPLLSHFHPSVSVHALQLLEGGKITTNADLSLNTLSHFLDRFVYRNPKQKSSLRGASAMQPMAQVGTGVTRSRTHALNENEFFNTEAFWKKRADMIPADQLFFHKFFNLKSTQPSSSCVQTGGGDDDEDALTGSDDEVPMGKGMEEMEGMASDSSLDSDDDADEKEIWKAMKATMPGKEELEGLDDSDVDVDEEEFDYVDSDEEGEAAEGQEDEDEEDSSDDDDGPNANPGMTFSDEETESKSEPVAPTAAGKKSKKKKGGAAEASNDWEDDDSDGGNVFDEDDDDLLPFTDFNSKKRGAADSDDEEEQESEGDAKKRKKQNDKKKRKKSMQNLPTFASADDYAHLLGGDDDEAM